jgi:SAM-dependent methyltransferase
MRAVALTGMIPGAMPTGIDFDQRAATWDDPAKVERARLVADGIAAWVPDLASKSLLEYGCGTGLLGLALRPRVARATLADSSEGMLAMTRNKVAALGAADVEVIHLDLTREPPPERRFDVVCSLLTLHHIHETEDVLRKLAAFLPGRGHLCLSDLDAEDGSFHGAGFDGHHGFDREDLAHTLRRVGFGEVRFTTVCDVEKHTAGGLRRFPLFLAVAVKG